MLLFAKSARPVEPCTCSKVTGAAESVCPRCHAIRHGTALYEYCRATKSVTFGVQYSSTSRVQYEYEQEDPLDPLDCTRQPSQLKPIE